MRDSVSSCSLFPQSGGSPGCLKTPCNFQPRHVTTNEAASSASCDLSGRCKPWTWPGSQPSIDCLVKLNSATYRIRM